jgi:hypothetical protein
MDRKNLFNFGYFGNRKKDEPIKIVFSRPLIDSKLDASITISKMDIPKTPQLEILEKAYSIGDELIETLSKKIIDDKKKGKVKKSFGESGRIFEEIIKQRSVIVSIIEKMVQPTINVTGDHSLQLNKLWNILFELDKRIQKLEETMKNVYGSSPNISLLKDGKIPWHDTMKAAAEEIIEAYQGDEKNSIKLYRSLRDASDEYYEQHIFIRNPDLTKDMLYENVKKANNYLGKRGED